MSSCKEKRNKRKHQSKNKKILKVFVAQRENIALKSNEIDPNGNGIPDNKQTLRKTRQKPFS